MTKEEKTLLIQDISARLSYGMKATTTSNGWNDVYTITGYANDRIYLDCPVYDKGDDEWLVEFIKPYLRPMESMTEEEIGEYAKFKLSYDDVYEFTDFKTTGKGFINVHTSCKNGGCGYTFQFNNKSMLYDGIIGIDWLNKKHFDYRKIYDEKSGKWKSLIEKGLALEAPEGMYKHE